jgi:hypothetical protein
MNRKSITSLLVAGAVLASATVVLADCFVDNVPLGSFAHPLLCEIPTPTNIIGTAWGSSGVSVTVNVNGGVAGQSFAASHGFLSNGNPLPNCVALDSNTNAGISNTDSTQCSNVARQDLELQY